MLKEHKYWKKSLQADNAADQEKKHHQALKSLKKFDESLESWWKLLIKDSKQTFMGDYWSQATLMRDVLSKLAMAKNLKQLVSSSNPTGGSLVVWPGIRPEQSW